MIFDHHDDDYVKGMSYTYCYGYHSVVNGRNDNDHWENDRICLVMKKQRLITSIRKGWLPINGCSFTDRENS